MTDKMRELLTSGLNYMIEGKRKYAPNTTNSFVDDWIGNTEQALAETEEEK